MIAVSLLGVISALTTECNNKQPRDQKYNIRAIHENMHIYLCGFKMLMMFSLKSQKKKLLQKVQEPCSLGVSCSACKKKLLPVARGIFCEMAQIKP